MVALIPSSAVGARAADSKDFGRIRGRSSSAVSTKDPSECRASDGKMLHFQIQRIYETRQFLLLLRQVPGYVTKMRHVGNRTFGQTGKRWIRFARSTWLPYHQLTDHRFEDVILRRRDTQWSVKRVWRSAMNDLEVRYGCRSQQPVCSLPLTSGVVQEGFDFLMISLISSSNLVE